MVLNERRHQFQIFLIDGLTTICLDFHVNNSPLLSNISKTAPTGKRNKMKLNTNYNKRYVSKLQSFDSFFYISLQLFKTIKEGIRDTPIFPNIGAVVGGRVGDNSSLY